MNDEHETQEQLHQLKPSPIPGDFSSHHWVQRGPWLVCKLCAFEHGLYIGIEKRFYGLDKQSKPIFKKV